MRALFDDRAIEMERRYNFEVALLHELVDYTAARPAGRAPKIEATAAKEAA
jgi:hypothetical protein